MSITIPRHREVAASLIALKDRILTDDGDPAQVERKEQAPGINSRILLSLLNLRTHRTEHCSYASDEMVTLTRSAGSRAA